MSSHLDYAVSLVALIIVEVEIYGYYDNKICHLTNKMGLFFLISRT